MDRAQQKRERRRRAHARVRLTVSGTAEVLDVSVPGAGSFEGADLRAARADAETSGVGSITVWVTDVLDARVTGVGSIDYYGSPQGSRTVTGVGAINDRGEK